MNRLLLASCLLATVILGSAFAQTVDDLAVQPETPAIGLGGGGIGPTGITDELNRAHAEVVDIMTDTALTRASTGDTQEVHLAGTWVDEREQHLVVMLDPLHAVDPVSEDDLREVLGLGLVPIDVIYGHFRTDGSSSSSTCPAGASILTCYYWDRYVSECRSTPSISKCRDFAGVITRAGLALPTAPGTVSTDTDGDGINDDVDQCDMRRETFNGYQDEDGCPDTPPAPPPKPVTSQRTVVPAGGIIFQDDFENGLGKWRTSGQNGWQTGPLDERAVIRGYTSSNTVAEADGCNSRACILHTRSALDLSGYKSATLEFDRFVDASLSRGEYLAVHIGREGSYREVFRWTDGRGDDDRWHHETVDLARHLVPGFHIRFSTEQSSIFDDVAVDNMVIRGVPRSSCSIVVSSTYMAGGPLTASWNSCNGISKYHVYASVDGGQPTSLGSTTGTTFTYSNAIEGKRYVISVKAQNTDGSYTASFSGNPVTVPYVDRIRPVIRVPDNISVAAESSMGARVSFVVTTYDTRDGSISAKCNPASGSVFPVGSTVVKCEASDNAGNMASKNFTVTVSDYEPECTYESRSFDDYDRACIVDGISGSKFAPTLHIRGGEHLGRDYDQSSSTRSDIKPRGVITIGAEKNGVDGFVTAAHLLATPAAINDDQRFYISRDGYFPLITAVPAGYAGYQLNNNHKADAVFLPVRNGISVSETIIESAGPSGIITITSKGGIGSLPGYPTVMMIGAETESYGHVTYRNAAIKDEFGNVNLEQFLAVYTSVKGDSGGPIIGIPSNGMAPLYGLHVAKACIFQPEGFRDYYTYEGESCTKTPIKAFSSWENVVDRLGLE
ncbi:MAG: HYR domain-containing protein [Gammaproteobacteria bacterium]|nr:HYR domain-containing protein [Gammaproteobacteria bacterium]